MSPTQAPPLRKVPGPANITKTGRKEPAKKSGKFKPPESMPPGNVFIYCNEPAARFKALMGPDPWIPTDGFGGWEVVDRPHQVGMTIHNSTPPYQYTGSVVFEGWHSWPPFRRSQERNIKQLMLMAHGDDDHEPGVISIVGVPDLPAEDWVIEALDFDADMVIRDPYSMERLRQMVTLTIREYITPDYIRNTKGATGRPKGNYTFVHARKGDTVHKVAVRHKVAIRDIIQLNKADGIKKANQKLKEGRTIRIPIPDSKKNKNKKNKTKTR